MVKPDVSAPSAWWTNWQSIDWTIVYEKVWRQQVSIAKAVQERRWGKVSALQRALVRSLPARLLAVRRVTTNKDKRTPGVDGVLWNTPPEEGRSCQVFERTRIQAVTAQENLCPQEERETSAAGNPDYEGQGHASII